MRILVAAAVMALAMTAPVAAEDQAGELRCMVAGGIGFVVASQRATSCVYYRRDGRVEFYIGSFSCYGLDVIATQARSAVFTVLTKEAEPIGALDGDFVGVGLGDTIGRGVAGDALVGGPRGSIQIIQIANSRPTGLDANVGIGALHLRYAGTEGRRERYRSDKPEDGGF